METSTQTKAHASRPIAAKHEYVQLRHANPEHEKYVVINWCYGNTCNYACSYCPKDLHEGTTPWVEYDQATRFIEKVLAHYGAGKKFFFEFTGGEITLFKEFLRLASFIRERGAKLGIISNGSRAMPFWEKARPLLNQICLSFHPESADPEHFLRVVSFMSQEVRTHVNVMMVPEKFDLGVHVATRAKDIENISLALQPLMINFGSELFNYSEAQKQLLDQQEEQFLSQIKRTREFEYYRGTMNKVNALGQAVEVPPHALIASGENNWLGWNCAIGLEQFVVDQEGNLLRGWCGVGGRLGNIKDESLRLPVSGIRCTKSFCHCNLDIMATKEAPL